MLEQVNLSMSTYRDDSEISRFNALAPMTWFAVSPDFYAVLSTALAVGWQSDGAYDVTVGPLVDLWGFGPDWAIDGATAGRADQQRCWSRWARTHLRLDGDDRQRAETGRAVARFFLHRQGLCASTGSPSG